MSKHMTDFVSENLDHSLKDPTFKFFSNHIFFGPFWHQSMDALDSTVLWTSDSECIVATSFGEEINIGQSDDTDCIFDTSLDWTNYFLENLISLELCFA